LKAEVYHKTASKKRATFNGCDILLGVFAPIRVPKQTKRRRPRQSGRFPTHYPKAR